MWELTKTSYRTATILMLTFACTLGQYARAQEIPEKPVKPSLGEKTLSQQKVKKAVEQAEGRATLGPTNAQTFVNIPSDTAREEGFKKNEGFDSLSDYSQPGYVGNGQFKTKPPAGAVVAPPPGFGIKPPQCNALHILEKGNLTVVKSCSAKLKLNAYTLLCQANNTSLRKRCQKLCNLNRKCQNWQLRPHIYEEWGCLEGHPKSTIKIKPRRYCDTAEGCICTSTPS